MRTAQLVREGFQKKSSQRQQSVCWIKMMKMYVVQKLPLDIYVYFSIFTERASPRYIPLLFDLT